MLVTAAASARSKNSGMEDSLRILELASREEIGSLATVLACDPHPTAIISALQEHSSHFLSRLTGQRPPYLEILRRVAAVHKLEARGQAEQIERQIVKKFWGDLWNRLTPEQREEMDNKLREESEKKGSGLTGTALTGAGLIAANAGGFATYMMASTIVGTLTSALGLALPFAFYTGMSSAIAVVLGPVGWLGLALVALWQLGKPDLSRVTTAVCIIAAVRGRLAAQNEKPVQTKFWIIASLAFASALFCMIYLILAR